MRCNGHTAGKWEMKDVGRYRQYAANCLKVAQSMADPNAKLALLDMVQVWIMLADEAERNGGLIVDPSAETLRETA